MGVGLLKDSTGQLVTADENMAEMLNNFFCSVFTREDTSTIPEAEQRFLGMQPLESVHITAQTVQKKLEKLKPNSAPGPDKLWPRILQKAAEVISLPLAIIYTKCLEEEAVPGDR